MSTSILARLTRAFKGLWWFLDATRRGLLNLLLLVLLVALAWALLKPGAPALKPKTALVLDLAGPVVEQRTGSAREAALQQLQGAENDQTRLRDVLAVLDAAAKDPNISHALLMLDNFAGAGLPTLREIGAAIERLKAAGKPVYAWGSNFNQRQYYLAARASEIWLHPMGSVLVEGYGRYRNYYKDLFERVGVKAHVIRAGRYKNAGETYAAAGPSPETVESDAALYGSLWSVWTQDVEKARQQPAGSIAAAIESLPGGLAATGGDPARWALQHKWVDALKTRDEMRQLMISKGAPDEGKDKDKTFQQVGMAGYLNRIKTQSRGDAVGVIVAQGSISDGRAGPGSIGGLSTAELVRKARHDDRIKALVLRVNSPGGSGFGSELVRRELELTRQAGKPVVVSMGDVAASGGYWISMAADQVIADPTTITGSIGVVGILPTAEGLVDKLDVRVAGAGTTWLVGAYDPRRAMDPRFEQLIQSVISHYYGQFTTLVAKARKSTPEKIDAIAQGRVWSGQQALERGLVDRLGGLSDAVAEAVRLGKLPADAPLRYIEAEPGRLQLWMERLGVQLPAVWQPPAALQHIAVAFGWGGAWPAAAAQDLAWLAEAADRSKPLA
ncbi:MAG TPA: signal peptide peptidase SppA, partial [Rubrivivax sp.]|nr:signal peptide peptidase SppA [Rubrivivax sp.]